MAHIFILYRLKAGISREEFEIWLKTNNSEALRSIKRLKEFTVFRIEKRVMAESQASIGYIELFEIPDIAGFINEDIPGDVLRKDMEQFGGFADRPEYLLATPVTTNKPST